MRCLVAIARILLLAGLLIGQGALACPTDGLSGSPDACLPSPPLGASGDSGWACCCGPDENRCDAPPESLGATMERVRQAWDLQLKLGQQSALAAVCAPSKEDGCACWRPRQPDSSLPTAVASPFFELAWAEPPLTIVIDPPRRVVSSRPVALAPPPLRPPIEGEAWSIDLLPLPPPVRV